MNTYLRPPRANPSERSRICAKSRPCPIQVVLAASLLLLWGCSTLDAGTQGQKPQVGGAERFAYADLSPPDVKGGESTTESFASEPRPAQQSMDLVEPALAKSLTPIVSTDQEQAVPTEFAPVASYRDEPPPRSPSSPALADKYANLLPAACRVEVRKRKIAAAADHGLAVGISAPMRITGPLHSVKVIAPGRKSIHGKLDCRLLLLLDEVCMALAELGVTSIHVDGFYRPRAHLPGKKSPSQHAYGLAIDIHAFGLKDGRTLVIERDFAGRIGAPVCGASAQVGSETRDSIELRNIVCAMARVKAFHYLLTPNHDPSHRNHLHGDIKRGAKEHVVR